MVEVSPLAKTDALRLSNTRPVSASRPVDSSQTTAHANLGRVVRRHLDSPWRQPLHQHSVQAFAELAAWRAEQGADHPLWLDSGCGTGRAAYTLALCHPEVLVVGVDQSAARLQRAARRLHRADNLLLLRADCADIWRLLVDAGWCVSRHYLFYPNPWPKPGHLRRRWHGHPAFAPMLAVGGRLEVRSNWLPYIEEMQQALALAGRASEVAQVVPQQPISDFEDKYHASGHRLWQLTSLPLPPPDKL